MLVPGLLLVAERLAAAWLAFVEVTILSGMLVPGVLLTEGLAAAA